MGPIDSHDTVFERKDRTSRSDQRPFSWPGWNKVHTFDQWLTPVAGGQVDAEFEVSALSAIALKEGV